MGRYVCGKKQSFFSKEFILYKPKTFCWDNQGVYVLKLQNGRYYVGKSKNIPRRIEQHRQGQGSSFVDGDFKRIEPQTPASDDWESWERAETLLLMSIHGVSQVRGWMFTTVELSEQQQQQAFSQMCERFDLCRKCGVAGHFFDRCG